MLRERLYQHLLPAYNRLFSLCFRQVHFHFPDGTSFLRLHLPEKFGDALFPYRESLRLANTEQRYVEGFEVGRNHHAFRYVFPLQKSGIPLGTVETSVPFYSVENSLQDVFNVQYCLLLRKDALDKKLITESHSKYTRSLLLPEYYHETDDLLQHKFRQEGHLDDSTITRINERLQGRIEEGIAAGKIFARTVNLSGRDYLVTFQPFKDFGGEDVGYFISYTRDTVLQAIRHKMIVIHLVVGTFFFLFFALYLMASRGKNEQICFQQRVLDTIPPPVWFRSPEDILTGANIAFRAMFGLPSEQKGNICIEDIWGEQASVLRRIEKEALLTQRVLECVVSAAPLYDGKGRFVALVEDFQDVKTPFVLLVFCFSRCFVNRLWLRVLAGMSLPFLPVVKKEPALRRQYPEGLPRLWIF